MRAIYEGLLRSPEFRRAHVMLYNAQVYAPLTALRAAEGALFRGTYHLVLAPLLRRFVDNQAP